MSHPTGLLVMLETISRKDLIEMLREKIDRECVAPTVRQVIELQVVASYRRLKVDSRHTSA